ncbi:DUF1989 domain-containing protein [Yoonia sp. 2307UL14-13]|uniref:DUF1989 domain-containing protein n=1 Tax=Yoonia sp. 2307UL14-13 TaxID=3126506 RepID=UPI0030B48ECF
MTDVISGVLDVTSYKGSVVTMHGGTAILDFSNIGLVSPARSFPGFPSTATENIRLAPRGARRVTLSPGDLVSITDNNGNVAIAAFDARGGSALAALGLVGDKEIGLHDFDSAEMWGWSAGKGRELTALDAARIDAVEPVILKSDTDCTVWFISPLSQQDVVAGGKVSDVIISVKRAMGVTHLPEPLGEVRDEFTIDRGTAQAYRLAKGEILQIIDVEGQQCSDFMAFRADALNHGDEIMIDSTATRSMVRQAYPAPGLMDKFFDRDMRPMLQVLQDTCGRHDTFGLACTARGYEDRGFPGHVNCSDNISRAMSPHGVTSRPAWPAINFFWNTWVDPHTHQILTEESHSRPGDYVAMQAMSDLVCVSTACPDDVDPINGWNPTDVHVRIYRPDAPIRRAVAYRVKEDTTMSISHESAFYPRTSALTQHFAAARDIWTPVSFPSTGTLGEYWACRENVTVQDMSGLRKYDIVGPDAEKLLQRLMTRNVTRLAHWRATYALMCDETGAVVDDGTLFRLGSDLFRWCCGSEESARRIEDIAKAEGLQVRMNDMSDALVNLALQGPKSRDLLSELIFTQAHVPTLDQTKWFGVTIARLHDRDGAPFMLSRTGYTGELGYELFCAPSDALRIWDAVMETGAAHGIAPMGNAALDIIRVEAGLAAAGAEFAPGHDAFEAGLGFAIDLTKSDFIGKTALVRNASQPRRLLKGLLFEGDDVPLHGAAVYAGERQIGQVTSATRSPMLERGIAMARLAVEHAANDTTLEVGMMDGRMKRLPARVTDIPFVDPRRERARA